MEIVAKFWRLALALGKVQLSQGMLDGKGQTYEVCRGGLGFRAF